ncbi:MAG: hypothetical protein IT565_06465, partial [Rhodospirillales bacterium]|nr:hypothetical protein [Rhodospirillales bacterium]
GQGTGQGLAIVHAIIRRHGGAVDVESEPGKGSRFRFLIPIRGAALDHSMSGGEGI